jgi:CspA family cold shock protein
LNTPVAALRNKSYLRRSILIKQYKMDSKNTGTVKFFNSEKGFGFIKHDDSNKETFVHASGLIDEIKENDKVEFDLQNGKKGMNAVNVKLIG